METNIQSEKAKGILKHLIFLILLKFFRTGDLEEFGYYCVLLVTFRFR